MDESNAFFGVDKARSDEESSLPGLDAGFLLDIGSSIDQQRSLQGVHASRSKIVVEYTEAGSSAAASVSGPASVLSPSLVLQAQSPNWDRTPGPNQERAIPGAVLSSTPCQGKRLKPAQASSLNLSGVHLAAFLPSLELSRIKRVSDSSYGNSLSPMCRPGFLSQEEFSFLIQSGAGLQANKCTESRRPWKEPPLMVLNQTSSINASDLWQTHTSVISICAENEDPNLSS